MAIGNPTEVINCPSPEHTKNNNNNSNKVKQFKEECTNYLSLVLMGNPTPVDDVSGLCPIEWFGMEVIRKANQPTCYKFYCFPAQRTQPKHVNVYYFYQTINANAILRDVRRFLKEERWMSKHLLMGPLKAKLTPSAFSSEQTHIETFISKAFDIERRKALPYLLYCHREHVQNKKYRK